ncbi:MAG: hypothetical protein HXX16_20570 [Bacteroidales bacterium]|nr:hypothetical protein [Bacteroidales bacterium]
MKKTTKVFVFLFIIIFGQNLKMYSQSPCIPLFNYTDSYVNNVAFHTMANIYSGVNQSGYTTFPSALFTTKVAIGKKYPLNVSDDDYWNGDRCAVWIDYNNDNQFDPSECVLSDTVQSPSLSGIVSIPQDSSYIGERRMRVMCVWSLGGTLLPCDSYEDGEAEDYMIEIAASAPDTLTYCVPFNPEGADQFVINDFKLGTIQNLNSGTNYTGYMLYSQESFTTDLIMGTSNSFYICTWSPIAGVPGGFAIWIDLDNDGVFSNSERLFQTSSTNYVLHINGSILIPYDSSFVGLRRMRVRSSFVNVPLDPCSLYRAGESEDYIVNIKAATTSTPEIASQSLGISLFPNPSHGKARLECDKPIEFIRIDDLVGNNILMESPYSEQLNIQIEKPGIYIVTVLSESKISRVKLIITN